MDNVVQWVAAALFLSWISPGLAQDRFELVRSAGLANNESRYLSSHADDSVLWQPLDTDSLQISVIHNRPILISSGYLSCYWCFRMGEDTFHDPVVAAYINQHFFPILIDSELMATEDEYLQEFMRETQKFSGWPANVLLTPDGYPVFGFSYVDSGTMLRLLEKFIGHWTQSAADIYKAARADAEARVNTFQSGEVIRDDLKVGDLLLAFVDQVSSVADEEYGGFGAAEKYLFVPQLEGLVSLSLINPDPALVDFIRNTLDAVLASAMVDELEGGIFRYSDSRAWDSPHFEQMLFTQALFARLLFKAELLLPGMGYAESGAQILRHVVKRFPGPDGWFVSSLSAVSGSGEQGGYYTWEPGELAKILSPGWEEWIDDLAPALPEILPGIPDDADPKVMRLLREERDKRKLRQDATFNAGWNGLVLSALAWGGRYDESFVKHGNMVADYLTTLDPADTLQDDVYVAGGLLDWWQFGGDERYLEAAISILVQCLEDFHIDGVWHSSSALLPLAAKPAVAIKDSQLPSPTGEWFRLVSMLKALGETVILPHGLSDVHAQMKTRWSKSMVDEAFFHATKIVSLVETEWAQAHSAN